jgi:hypothetical protein
MIVAITTKGVPRCNHSKVNKNLLTFFFFFQFGKCRNVAEFEKLNRIGEGSYGVVCKFFINPPIIYELSN